MAIQITAAEKSILQNVTIPPRPEALLAVSSEAKKTEPNLSLIASSIAGDIGISAAVLQVVNSAAFRRVREIESIEQAVMILGLKRVFPIVKAVALKASMTDNASLEEFWRNSNKIAQACSLVAQQLDKAQLADNAYMLGLFHGAGIPVMLQEFDGYTEVLQKASEDGWDYHIIEIEREQFNTAHTTIGALLGQQWKLPKDLIDVIYYQHDTNGLFESTELSKVGLWMLGILKLSRHIIFKNQDDSTEWESVQDSILEFMGLEESELAYIIEQVENGLA